MRHTLPNQLAELNLELRWHSEAGSVLHRSLESVENYGRRVSEDERSPRENEVNVFVTIDIPDPRALAACDNDRLSSNSAKCAYGRVHSARKEIARPLHNFGRARCVG